MPIKFAGKLNAFSRGPRGFFVKLEIGGDDDWQELAASPLGTTFGIVMVPINPETGVRTDASPGADHPPRTPDAGQRRDETGKSRQPFHKLSRAQQAGILANERRFQWWASTKGVPGFAGIWSSVPEEAAAQFIRLRCGVNSRSFLDHEDEPAARWDRLVAEYREDTGQQAEARA